MQKRRNSSALVMELRLSCINPSTLFRDEIMTLTWTCFRIIGHLLEESTCH